MPRTLQRRRHPIALALAGGGPLGGIYEIGALTALADSLEGSDGHHFVDGALKRACTRRLR